MYTLDQYEGIRATFVHQEYQLGGRLVGEENHYFILGKAIIMFATWGRRDTIYSDGHIGLVARRTRRKCRLCSTERCDNCMHNVTSVYVGCFLKRDLVVCCVHP